MNLSLKDLTLSGEIVHLCKLSDLLNTEHSHLSIIIEKRRPRSANVAQEKLMGYA